MPTIGSVGAAVVKNYTITDTTTGAITQEDGSHYPGPVGGIWNQYASITLDSINIMANVPSTFIHAGPGTDSIDVSKVAGNNIIDGSTGSNFLTGGVGIDTFYIDDRNPSGTLWSSLINFHTGDNATVWGVNTSDFTLTWLDNQGAVGHTGLTGVFTNKATGGLAAVTVAGYSQADLSNGRLSVAYNRTPDLPGLPGSNYMQIHGN